ncbi:MAG: peptide MFS transporter [Dysgonamonadaceae bacterium]|jgi:POT family proton-dependent oligopeptide transporter|nr:peptide MFS transporter [Dysgonamonadaceae bacterium]
MNSEIGIEREEPQLFGHPKGLAVLFFAEMWERFCYYGMRGLLVLYLTKAMFQGDAKAFAIYGAFTALVYMAPVLGGRIADNILGYRIAILLGAALMAIGEFMILGGNEAWLYAGMAAIIVGNGYFKANISTLVGKLYKANDPRRDSGFTIFYIGINIGALLATLVCVYVGETFGFKYGFGLAGIGMLLGFFIFWTGQKFYLHLSHPPHPEKLHKKVFGPLTQFHVTILLSILLIPVLYLLIAHNTMTVGSMEIPVVGILLGVTAVYMIYILLKESSKGGKVLKDRMIIFITLCFFNIVFWSLFEQAGSSLTLFADRNVNRIIEIPFFGQFEMGAGQTQFFNPFFIILMGSFFSVLWVKLAKRNMNPNIPAKFGIGIILLGIGYLITFFGKGLANEAFLVPLWILIALYFFHTVGELFISPIGLSMVTKLAPPKISGTMMGAWFLSFSGSNYVASMLAKLTGASGEEAGVQSAEASLHTYIDVYVLFGGIAVGVGLVVLLLSPRLNKLMHGIK